MKTVKLKPKEGRRIQRGHPWVFSNELERTPGGLAPGELVDVLDHGGRFIGRGYINPHSLIAIRLLTRKQEPVDLDFLRRKISSAHVLRKRLCLGDSFRAVFSEGDGLPGLIVDKYAGTLVVQSLTAGIDALLDDILAALTEEYAPAAIVLRNDAAVREIEGLAREKGVVYGSVSGPVTIEESGINYRVDVLEGQKTGFFLDQRENRQTLRDFAQGRRTLDCFCYVGAWALSAARFGATEVIGLDSSEAAVKLATENAALNNLAVHFKTA
ncbi:MAG TPA: class I SAM-dependent rRNA methyltransferase, partial [Nitrospirota bacterium]